MCGAQVQRSGLVCGTCRNNADAIAAGSYPCTRRGGGGAPPGQEAGDGGGAPPCQEAEAGDKAPHEAGRGGRGAPPKQPHGWIAPPDPQADENRGGGGDVHGHGGGEECVHHVWVTVAGAAEPPPACLELSVQSIAPCRQIIWVWAPDVDAIKSRVEMIGVTRVVVCDASELVPYMVAQCMLRQHTAIQWLKDIVVMTALYKYGGWATDLDVIGVRPVSEWPSKKGYAFALSPQRQDAMKSKHAEISLSIVRMPRGAPEASLMRAAFIENASNHSGAIARGERAPCEWMASQCTKSSGWLANQCTLHTVVMAAAHLTAAVFAPEVFIPLPIWLRRWPPCDESMTDDTSDQAVAAEPPAATRGTRTRGTGRGGGAPGVHRSRIVCKRPSGIQVRTPTWVISGEGVRVGRVARHCFVPNLRQIEKTACAINVWWRQWPVHVRTAAALWAGQARRAHGSATVVTRDGIVAELEKLACELRAYVTVGQSYTLLGGAIQMVDAEPMLGRMPGLVRSIGSGSATVAAVLMLIQLALVGRASNLASREMDDASPSAMDDFISDCTDVTVASMAHIHESSCGRARSGNQQRRGGGVEQGMVGGRARAPQEPLRTGGRSDAQRGGPGATGAHQCCMVGHVAVWRRGQGHGK